MCDDADWQDFVRRAIEAKASVHLTVGQRPHMRCLGTLQPMDRCPLTEGFLLNNEFSRKEIGALINHGT